jgi:hypothetical protein
MGTQDRLDQLARDRFLALKGDLLPDPVPPFPSEPAPGSPEAVEAAAETIRRLEWSPEGMRPADANFLSVMLYVRETDLMAEQDRLGVKHRERLREARESEKYWKEAAEKALADLDRQHALAAEGSKLRAVLADALAALDAEICDVCRDLSVNLAGDRRNALQSKISAGRAALRKAGR